MTLPEPRPINLLALLLGGALVLSLGLNGVLLASRPETWPDDDATGELLATTAELHLTQRLLAHCQHQHQQQDSLLVLSSASSLAPAQ